ncbi:MAG: hypothetical protein CMG62_04265 [Candidatus Marinimicrobia bacterium]|nr:hypothetical protein [Candidatus Neomarinimicrobiota bacterium]|tara:strand:- start:2343 stop:3191 length:849 start_codon:yes stop_codon:yes gene_type:complete
MVNKIIRSLSILIIQIFLQAQFKNVNVTFDDRLLRSNEKQEIFSLKQNINQFLTSTTWDEAYSDLDITLHLQIIFESSQAKGNVKTYNCQSLFSNGGDLRYFDKQVQFYYNSGTSLYFDPVLFEPLPGFLAYYAYIILAGEIDTYEFNGGNNAYELAREIAQRGTASDYKKGWGNRITIIDDINRNIGLRKARLAFYIGQDLFNNGTKEEAINELKIMLDGLEQSYRDVGRDHNTQYFLKTRSNAITSILIDLGRKDMLIDMQGLDPDRLDIYQEALDLISE